MKILHQSAKPSHYNKEAESYDKFNEKNSKIINQTIGNILKEHHVKTVLDLTCGTGSQVFSLAKKGYQVVGCDINSKMLKIAKSKAESTKLALLLIQGDMRNIQVGEFDAVITIFNSIGHLTIQDFEKALLNIYNNLNPEGIYIFDIFNLDYLLYKDNITRLTIDWQQIDDDKKVRVIQYSTINNSGVLVSHTVLHEQTCSGTLNVFKDTQTLQVYSAQQLKNMLEKTNFIVLKQLAIDGSKFNKNSTERIITIAKKTNFRS